MPLNCGNDSVEVDQTTMKFESGVVYDGQFENMLRDVLLCVTPGSIHYGLLSARAQVDYVNQRYFDDVLLAFDKYVVTVNHETISLTKNRSGKLLSVISTWHQLLFRWFPFSRNRCEGTNKTRLIRENHFVSL